MQEVMCICRFLRQIKTISGFKTPIELIDELNATVTKPSRYFKTSSNFISKLLRNFNPLISKMNLLGNLSIILNAYCHILSC